MDALFLLKHRQDYSGDTYTEFQQIGTGMYNSAKFVSDELNLKGLSSDVQITTDGNTVDAAVTLANPKIVFIEGLWVTPAKFAELMALPRHAGRIWAVRIHSEIAFLSSEGSAMEWISEYVALGVRVAPNSDSALDQLVSYMSAQGFSEEQLRTLMPYLPNCYPTNWVNSLSSLDTSAKSAVDVGCFGALRPLKNQLQQALVAMRYARSIGKGLRFHVNGRADSGGSGPARNIAGMFNRLPEAFELVVHDWEDRDTFLQTLRSIDFVMQDSFSETFNMVAAAAVFAGRPVLGSDEISWLYPLYSTPTDQNKSLQVLQVLQVILANKPFFIKQNRSRLKAFAKSSAAIWVKYVQSV
jgi:hypothetical protein